ncbi:hypothetical protein NW768_009901 [Fusarium equiseti]|uniref:Beta-xylosidase C-terminal Concanavalin A-like domain-containing protein n=1 Tax=Fusarium equiseti TaxID=61235 RepID=A0ABQ8R1Z6_FUSEQ|nr:hypothetical protein NW768_009901 [Fusarium equiseti]
MRIAWRDPNSKQKDFAIHISEIDISTGRTLTPSKVIRESPYGIAEGSHIFKREDWYYLLTAEGGTELGHQEWVLRSKDGPYGPWESQGRETFLVKVEWKDDWPIFNEGNNITLKTAGRDIVKTASKPAPQIWKANLQRDNLELGWYQKGMFSPKSNDWHY